MSPRKLFFYLPALLVACSVCSQTRIADSLKMMLVHATDTLRPFILNKMAEEITDSIAAFRPEQKDSFLFIAKKYVQEAAELSAGMNYTTGMGMASFLSGEIKVDYSPRNMAEAITDYMNSLPYLKTHGPVLYRAYCYYRIAAASHFIGRLDKSIAYYDSAIGSFFQLKDTITAIRCMIWQGHDYFDKGDYKNAYLFGTKALNAAQKIGDTSLMVFAYTQFEDLFLKAGLPERAIDYLHIIIKLHPLTAPRNGKTTLPDFMPWALWSGGEAYLKLNKIDSAVYLSQFIPEDTTDGDSYKFYGQLCIALHQEDKAIEKFVQGFELKKAVGHEIGLAGNAIELGQMYLKKKKYKLATYYAGYGLSIAEKIQALLEKRNAVGTLSDIYAETGNYELAYFYSQRYKALSDSVASDEDRRELSLDLIQKELDNQRQQAMLLAKNNQLKEQQLQNEKLIKNFLVTGALALLVVAVIIFLNYKQKQKANYLLESQKEEIQKALSELKSTQAQLIQSEKMASLGQLTAGIAHEIQNPLNFVNNFSELNSEMIDEARKEIDKGNYGGAKIILNDIRDNSEKINQHGSRADAIVKGMLMHSRTSTGRKESSDINALAEEYLRISYHGFRAKDKDFNATLKTDFDEHVGRTTIIPQDIGRVFLNLYNNAFYAVTEKSSFAKATADKYEPIVSVSTKKMVNKVLFFVKDNGNGIAQNIVDKIFQPFFTTKPTGQGTGLGLSLAYDIVKAHGGEIRVESKEGEYSQFIVVLPV